jgi:Tol biopolymer transport system component
MLTGQTISHYRVHSKVGEGGMGVVYKAEDLKLGRVVALKFIAPNLVSDEQTRKRFVREAMAAASLDHPNIATVFEIDEADGSVFLAMSFVEGRALKDLIAERPLKLHDLLDIAVQTATALQAAHARGVIHRDVKPGNLMVNPQGQVKVMDFGLAQLSAPVQNTQTVLTEVAAKIGTPAYMSPEQAQGRSTDPRTDIWSLGVVLYEMATGSLPFAGSETLAVFHAVVHQEPERLTARRAGLPIELDWIVAKCLAKDPAERYQHMADLIVDLTKVRRTIDSGVRSTDAALRGQPAGSGRMVRNAALMAAAIAAAVAATLLVSGRLRVTPEVAPPQRTVKFTFTPERLSRGSDTDIDVEVAVSPDGRHISYVESAGGQLWVRDIDQEHARPVPGAASVARAFWSPDSRFIAYAEGRELKRIPAQGGTPTTICRVTGNFRGGTWSRDGQTIVYADQAGLHTVAAAGGSPTRVIEHPHLEEPSVLELPDRRQAFLFQVVDRPPHHEIQYLVSGDEQRHSIITPTSSNPYPIYSPTGHLLYVDGSGPSLGIWALPFSLEGLRATGKPFPVAQQASSPRLSLTGTLVYSDAPVDLYQLAWCDRSGKVLSTLGAPQLYTDPALSPDDRRLAVSVNDGGRDLWIYEFDRPTMTRFTFEAALARAAAWSPSGEDLVYSRLADSFDLYSKRSIGGGEPLQLVSTAAQEFASVWSHDHRYFVYDTGFDIFYRERKGDGSLGEPLAFLQTTFAERTPTLSADGTYLAYVSNESGRNEIYVRPFPAGENRWRVSTNGGTGPRWRRDGRELVYIQGDQLMAVSVTTQPTLSLGTPSALFSRRYLTDLTLHPQYDVTSDGKRFIVRERLAQKPLAVHVAHNWFEEFRGQK